MMEDDLYLELVNLRVRQRMRRHLIFAIHAGVFLWYALPVLMIYLFNAESYPQINLPLWFAIIVMHGAWVYQQETRERVRHLEEALEQNTILEKPKHRLALSDDGELVEIPAHQGLDRRRKNEDI